MVIYVNKGTYGKNFMIVLQTFERGDGWVAKVSQTNSKGLFFKNNLTRNYLEGVKDLMTSRKNKKLLSIILVLTMILTLLPATLGLAAYDSLEAFVENVYKAVYERVPDEEGFNWWIEKLSNQEQTACQFIGFVLLDAPEFKEKFADISNEAFVEKLYKVLFNREPDEEGLKYWIEQLELGYSRKFVIYAMMQDVTNAEFITFCQNVGIKVGRLKLDASDYPAPEPEKLEVVGVSAINLKQISVLYNMDIEEGDEAAKKGNYKLVYEDDEEIEISNINVYGNEVILTLDLEAEDPENQSKGTLTIKKAVTGEAIEEEIEFIDLTIPSVLGAKVIGQDTVKVYFSEPMQEPDKDAFKINDGDYFIEEVKAVNNNTEINVKTYAAFDEDTIKIEVTSKVKDFAGLSVLSKTFEVEVPDDKEAPYVIGYKDASKFGVTLIFNEDIELNDYDKEDFYHTNSNNTVNDVKLNGAELKLNFNDNPLPEGKAYVYVAGEVVRDLFGNVQKNVIRVVIEVKVDETAPTIKEVKAESQSKLVVTFSEAVEDGAEKKGNYTILDSKGKEVDVIKKVEQTANDKVVITLSDDLDYGKYTLVVKGVADLSANKANDSYEFTVDDNKAPEHPKEATLYTVNKDEYKLVIKFDEPMAVDGKYSVLNLENYMFKDYSGEYDGKYFDELNDEDDITISIKATDQNKAVEINIKGLEVTTNDKIVMARVADAAGNRTAKLQSDPPITIKKGSGIGFKSAKATARDTIVVEFDDNFKDFDKYDLAVKYGDGKPVKELTVSKVKTLSSSKIEITIKEELDYTAKYVDGENVYNVFVVVVDNKSTNKYGKTLEIGDKIEVSDKIAPALKKIEGEEVDYVVVDKAAKIVALYFEENIDPDTVSKVSFEVEDVKVTKAFAVDNVVYLVTDKAAAVNADVTQKAPIKDIKGNSVSDIDTEIAKEEDIKTDLVNDQAKIEASKYFSGMFTLSGEGSIELSGDGKTLKIIGYTVTHDKDSETDKEVSAWTIWTGRIMDGCTLDLSEVEKFILKSGSWLHVQSAGKIMLPSENKIEVNDGVITQDSTPSEGAVKWGYKADGSPKYFKVLAGELPKYEYEERVTGYPAPAEEPLAGEGEGEGTN